MIPSGFTSPGIANRSVEGDEEIGDRGVTG
jgi:hypothetical protein